MSLSVSFSTKHRQPTAQVRIRIYELRIKQKKAQRVVNPPGVLEIIADVLLSWPYFTLPLIFVNTFLQKNPAGTTRRVEGLRLTQENDQKLYEQLNLFSVFTQGIQEHLADLLSTALCGRAEIVTR